MSRRTLSICGAAIVAAGLFGCGPDEPKPGTVLDEAMRAGVKAESLRAAGEDYFHDMDYNLVEGRRSTFTPQQIEGRNTWLVWTGGNDTLRSEEHTSELQSRSDLVCRLLLEK